MVYKRYKKYGNSNGGLLSFFNIGEREMNVKDYPGCVPREKRRGKIGFMKSAIEPFKAKKSKKRLWRRWFYNY